LIHAFEYEHIIQQAIISEAADLAGKISGYIFYKIPAFA
jgi:hypothetical protein